MPEGMVQWFDQDAGEGRILHHGHRYAMYAASSDPHARVPGARVHFDIDHRAPGDAATHVILVPGTRVSRRQRRFGDLTGAATPDAKGTSPFAGEQLVKGRDLQRHPMDVVQRWARSLAAGDLDDAMLLYAPDASLRAGGEAMWGPAEIRRHLSGSSLLGGPAPTSVRGDDGTAVVRWDGAGPDGSTVESRLRITHGEIADQWLGEVWATVAAAQEPTPVEISTAGRIGEADRAYALDKLRNVLDTIDDPVLYASVRLDLAADPARERPALARATLDINGEPVRAHTAASTIAEAVDLLDARLRHRLEHLAAHRRALQRRAPASGPGEWRHGDLPDDRPSYFPRPAEDRQIVRHKTRTDTEATVDEAVFDLESMDYDFLLFTDLASGEDAFVERRPGETYRLQYLHGRPSEPGPDTVAQLTISDAAAPELTREEAREHLDLGGELRVFFNDRASGRGHVLYRRYDGNYGLITPPSATA